MNWDLYLTFMMAAVSLTIMPGPDNIYVLTESLSRGFYRGMSLSAGLASGVMVHTLLAATGIALLLREFPQLALFIRLAGTAYLIYLAYGAWREKPELLEVNIQGKQAGLPFWKSFWKGFVMNVLNPKVTLFFLALLPQFIDEQAPWSRFTQMSIMGGSFMLQAFLLFSVIAWLAAYLHSYLASERFWNLTRWLQVLVLVLIALGLWFV